MTTINCLMNISISTSSFLGSPESRRRRCRVDEGESEKCTAQDQAGRRGGLDNETSAQRS